MSKRRSLAGALCLCLALLSACTALPSAGSVRWPGEQSSQAARDSFYRYYHVAGSAETGYSVAGRRGYDLPAYFSAMGYPSGTEATQWSWRELGVAAVALGGFAYFSQVYLRPQSPAAATAGMVGGTVIALTWAWHARPRSVEDIVPEFNTYLRNRSGADIDPLEAP
jgi:hypothetical protein